MTGFVDEHRDAYDLTVSPGKVDVSGRVDIVSERNAGDGSRVG